MYVVQDTPKKDILLYDFESRETTSAQAEKKSAGLYLYNLKSLASGFFENYKLIKTVGGENKIIDKSKFMDRYSFIQDYSNILMIPFPHLNLINFIGMANKKEYVIWREKRGFFTALDRNGNLTTWSVPTGNILYSDNISAQLNNQEDLDKTIRGSFKSWLKNYEVYRASERDIAYTKKFNRHRDRSYQLLISKHSIDDMIDR